MSGNSHLWKIACEKLGLNVKKEPDTAVDFKSLFFRMRKRLKNGGELFHRESICLDVPIIGCMHGHNGIAVIGCLYSIYKLELEPNLRVVSQVKIENYDAANCLCFDDSYLVVGTFGGRVITFKMPTMEKLHTMMAHSGVILCITFNKDIDLVVTTSREVLTFWCLSSGTIRFTKTICDLDMLRELHLIPTPYLQNDCDCMLLCISLHSSYSLHFDSQQITNAKMNRFPLCNLDSSFSEHLEHLCSSYVKNPFVYFLCWSPSGPVWILLKYDAASGVYEEKGRFNCDFMRLLGVGKMYTCSLQSMPGEPEKIVINDLAAESELTSFVTSNYLHLGKDNACLVNGGFLDGLDGFNDKGVILVISDLNRISVVKWREWGHIGHHRYERNCCDIV